MGAWGDKPWENDSAADWFAGLHEETKLRDRVVSVLEAGVDGEGYESVRAATWVVVQLARVYMWPVEHLDEDIRLAIACLEEVWEKRLGPLCENDESTKAEIDAEIASLRGRL